MKLLHGMAWLLVLSLLGCSGKTENVGSLPNIKVSGYVMGQSLFNAEVILVGIDSNGQPQRLNGDYAGDRLYTDDRGFYEGYFNGAYTGPLMVVVRKRPGAEHETLIRCALLAGCVDELGSATEYGETYAVPDDFEIWGVIHQASQGMVLDVSWLTHLAAKLAFTAYVSDGVTCTQDACAGVLPVAGAVTAHTAFKSNDQVKNLFGLSANPIQTTAWYPHMSSDSTDSVQQGQQASHGLLAQQLEQVALDHSKSLTEALALLTNEFLSNKGQFYQTRTDDQALSLKYLLDQAVVQGQAIQNQGIDHAGVGQAVAQFETLSAGAELDRLTTAVGADLIADLDAQISKARDFVQNAQLWVRDLGVQGAESQSTEALATAKYASYFGDEMALELARVDQQWQTFKDDMVNELELFYQIQLEMIEYGLSCVRGGLAFNQCDTEHRLNGLASYNAETHTLRYQTQTLPTYNLVMSISGVDSSSETEGDFLYQFSYEEDLLIESETGLLTSGLVGERRAFLQVGLNQKLEVGAQPIIVAVGMYFPDLVVKGKERQDDGSYVCCETLRFLGENVVIETVGTKDVTVDNGPTHYNLLKVDLGGRLSEGSLDEAEHVEMQLLVNSDISSASLYFAENKFPSLDVRLDVAAFQEFAALVNEPERERFAHSDFAGWLKVRSDITATDPAAPEGAVVYLDELPGEVVYHSKSQFSDLELALQAVLDLPESTTGFEYAGFRYSGGETVLALWDSPDSAVDQRLASQCLKTKKSWSCTANTSVENLGCDGRSIGDASASVLEAFNFLRDGNCIPEVVIEGRGTYRIDYTNGGESVVPFADDVAYDVRLVKPLMLGVDSANLRLISRFTDADGNARPIANVSVLVQALDEENVTLGASVTQGYRGSSAQDLIGIDWVVPYGENTLWMAVGTGKNAEETDEALAFYIQDEAVTLSMKAFESLSDHGGDVGFIRYAGALIGTVRKEGEIYVVRYLDNSWQLL